MSAKPVVLQVLTRMGAGGPPLFVVLVHRGIEARGYRTLLAVGSCYEADEDMSYILQPGDYVVRIPEMWRPVSPWRDAVALWKLYRLIRRVKPVIVQTHTAKAGALGRVAARLAGTPIVVHTFHGNVLNSYFSPRVSWLVRQAERCLARLADAICVLSPQQAEEMAVRYRIAPRAKFRVVPLGTNLGPYAALPPARLEDGCLTVGWLGRLVPIKDVPLLLEVARLAAARGLRARFLVAGDGPERASVMRAAEDLGPRVEYLGWRRDVGKVLERCHLLLQTSRNVGRRFRSSRGWQPGGPSFPPRSAGWWTW